MTVDSKWRKTLAWLRREHPIGKRVRVRRVKIKNQGETDYIDHRFEITILKTQCLCLRMDTLLHEWAHAMTWFGNDADPHGSEWGLMHAALYRTWLIWNYGRGLENEETDESSS